MKNHKMLIFNAITCDPSVILWWTLGSRYTCKLSYFSLAILG